MKKITIILIISICSLFLLTSCFKNNNRGMIPENTVGSFNIVGSPGGKAQLVVIGRDGKIIDRKKRIEEEVKNSKSVMATQEKTGGSDNKQFISITLRDGTCFADVCLPSLPCYPYPLDPNPDGSCPVF